MSNPETRVETVHMAEPLHGQTVEPVALYVTARLPRESTGHYLRPNEDMYKADADAVMRAIDALPQGTRYQVLMRMLAAAPTFYCGPTRE